MGNMGEKEVRGHTDGRGLPAEGTAEAKALMGDMGDIQEGLENPGEPSWRGRLSWAFEREQSHARQD